jgi:hypothetical protein
MLGGACSPAVAPEQLTKPVASSDALKVGAASLRVPDWLLQHAQPGVGVSDVWRRTFSTSDYRFEISYGRTGSVSRSDGGVTSWNSIQAPGGSGFIATYSYPGDGEERFTSGRRAVIFQDDFTRDPNARRLVIEGFCRSETACAAVTEMAQSVRFD